MEGLAPLVFFALIGLVQLLVRWLRTQQQRQQPPPQVPLPEDMARDQTLPRVPRAELPPVARVPEATQGPRRLIDNRVADDEELMVRTPLRPAPAAPASRRSTRRPHPRVGTRAEVRRAIVLMEILGPPRATDGETRGPRG